MNPLSKKYFPDFKDYTLYFLLFIMLVLFTRPAINHGDIGFWKDWTAYIFENGFTNVYQNEVNNYNPLFQYCLYIYNLIAGSKISVDHYLSFLKVFPLIFDFMGAVVAASLVNEKARRFTLSLLLLFNVGYMYNSVIWVQVDAIFTCLTFIAVVLALKKRAVWSFLFFLLALNAKTQAIIFFPILLMLWGGLWLRSIKSLGVSILAGAILQTLIMAPFMWFGKENGLARIIEINFKAVDFYPFVSMNSYNIWHFLVKAKSLMDVRDDLLFAGITYKHWGLMMFFLSSAIVLLPLFIFTVRNLIVKEAFQNRHFAFIMLTCGLIPICFCFFNTQMHERYWHPAILFLAAYAFLSRNYLIYIIASVAYFLNLEGVMRYLNMRNYSILFFDSRFVAGLFVIVLVWGIWQIYAQAEIKNWILTIWSRRKTGVSEVATV